MQARSIGNVGETTPSQFNPKTRNHSSTCADTKLINLSCGIVSNTWSVNYKPDITAQSICKESCEKSIQFWIASGNLEIDPIPVALFKPSRPSLPHHSRSSHYAHHPDYLHRPWHYDHQPAFQYLGPFQGDNSRKSSCPQVSPSDRSRHTGNGTTPWSIASDHGNHGGTLEVPVKYKERKPLSYLVKYMYTCITRLWAR